MENGTPFLREIAKQRINALADDFTISQKEAEELLNIAEQNGVDILPEDAYGRLEKLELIVNTFLEKAQESPILATLIEKIQEEINHG